MKAGPKQRGFLNRALSLPEREEKGLAVGRYFEALEICNEKFKLQASWMERACGGLSTTIHLTPLILRSVIQT